MLLVSPGHGHHHEAGADEVVQLHLGWKYLRMQEGHLGHLAGPAEGDEAAVAVIAGEGEEHAGRQDLLYCRVPGVPPRSGRKSWS